MTLLCANCGHGFGTNEDFPVSHVTSSNLLGTNRVPSQHQSDLIRDAISEMLPQLMHTEQEISQVQAMLDDLTAKRDKLRDCLALHKRQLSPILRFPPEIMGEIFLYSLPGVWKMTGKNPRKPYAKAVHVLGHVCKFWRQVSLTTPEMWSKISIPMASPRGINYPMLEAWLKRSSQTPLSIHLHGFCARSKKTLSKLTPHIHRWDELTCSLSDDRLWGELCKYMDRMSAVRTLVFEDYTSGRYSTEPTIVPSVSMPKLRQLHVHVSSPLTAGLIDKLPWSQISAVAITHDDPVEYLDHIRKAKSLISLAVRAYISPRLPTMQPIHSHLETLDLSDSPRYLHASDGVGRFLDLLTLPCLKNFKAKFSEHWPHEAFMSLISRSRCSLESLHIFCYRKILDDDILACLHSNPGLSELGFGKFGVGDAVLAQLAHDPSLVPGLETMCLYPSSVSQLNDLGSMVRSRSTSGSGINAKLKLLTLYLSSYYSHDPDGEQARSCIDALMRARPPGLRIRLLNGRETKLADAHAFPEISVESLFPGV